jgi:hypothetical protein
MKFLHLSDKIKIKWEHVATNFFFSLWKESPKFWEQNSLLKTCFVLKLVCCHIISMLTSLGKHFAKELFVK